ncbi:hypothetical protein KHQ06_08110 [Nocardia tengchongensis]|uniref:GIY-YIG domain-containing protein n=1 Tax=Nocardia tengchongensis TaxID=2055889 RepID=A0ABX8CSM8_9NOCA|nr:hypothetical protein [Nocardia tengchongensis]QVI22916.1 hypothetical protein KHQ06_08110 [Nocardia tengchongensis]
MSRKNVPGTVYLLHFDRPFQHARHYTGWTTDLDARLADHRAGRGARLVEVLRDNGIGWELARTWKGTRGRERQLKREGGASRRCPKCGVKPRPVIDAKAAEEMGAVIVAARRDITARHQSAGERAPRPPRWVGPMSAEELAALLDGIAARQAAIARRERTR